MQSSPGAFMKYQLTHLARLAALSAAILLACAAGAAAQMPPNTWSHGTTLVGFGGISVDSATTMAGTAGTGLGWELNHRTELQGTAAWLPERNGRQAFAADFKALFNLTRPGTVVPFAGGGVGLYRASFDTNRADRPGFYRDRKHVLPPVGRARFTDPTIVFAGGANVYVARHFSVVPAVDVRIVTDGSSTYTMTAATCAVAFHFENHERRGSRR